MKTEVRAVIAEGVRTPAPIPNTVPFCCIVAKNELCGCMIQDSSKAIKCSSFCIGNNRAISTRGINVGTLAFNL